jgi:hypothetical protein
MDRRTSRSFGQPVRIVIGFAARDLQAWVDDPGFMRI